MRLNKGGSQKQLQTYTKPNRILTIAKKQPKEEGVKIFSPKSSTKYLDFLNCKDGMSVQLNSIKELVKQHNESALGN